MKKVLTALPLMAVFLFTLVSASVLYQEDANAISSTGNWIGVDNVYDGYWDTYASGSYDAYGTYVYLNYTKPENALPTSLWEVKDHESRENLSLSEGCFSLETLQLRIHRITMTGFSRISWECYNGNDWEVLRITSLQEGYDVARAYEEAMNWEIGESSNGECTAYVGDAEFNLPQITSELTYDDSPTHKLYLACLYDLDGDSGYEDMIGTQDCRTDPVSFNPEEEGDHTYKLAIAFRERQWNAETHAWETLDEGIEDNLEYNFKVCDIPDDEEGHSGFITWIQGLLCSLFGWFC